MKNLINLILTITLSFLLLTSCELESEPPEDIATLEDKNVINETLNEIQTMFKSINVFVNIRSLPIVVTEGLSSSNLGECSYGNYIALEKDLFIDLENGRDSSNSISLLWSSLVHQIGRCYFNRGNSNEVVEPPLFNKFRVIKQKGISGSKRCRSFYYGDLPGSAMFSSNAIAFFPDSLKVQYLKELVGTDSVNNYRAYIRSSAVSLVNENESGDTDWRRCN